MAQQGTEPVRYVRTQNMFELAGAGLDFHFVADRQDIHEEPLRKAMPADHIARALLPGGRELLHAVSDGDETDAGQRRNQPAPLRRGEVSRLQMIRCFTAIPKVLQHFVEILILFGGEEQRFDNAAMVEIHPAIGQVAGVLVMRHHHDGAALRVKVAEDLEDNALIIGVQIACGLVRQDDLRIVDQRARDRDPLLLATRKLRRQVFCPASIPTF